MRGVEFQQFDAVDLPRVAPADEPFDANPHPPRPGRCDARDIKRQFPSGFIAADPHGAQHAHPAERGGQVGQGLR